MSWRNEVLAAVAAAWLWAFPAAASNVTDHWYSPAESGWGLSVTQQEDIAFIVMFVYDRTGAPTWFAGSAQRYGRDMQGNPGFAGQLYRTSGPWFGAPFDPAKLTTAPAGSVTFEANGIDSAILAYSIDGVAVTKTVQRLTFRNKDWSGLYRGVNRANYRACDPTFVPAFTYDDGLIDIEQDGSVFRMWFDGKKQACMYTGTYTQHGRVGSVTGTYVCADGPSGTFTLSGLETTERTFGARIDASHPSCSASWQDVAGFSLFSD